MKKKFMKNEYDNFLIKSYLNLDLNPSSFWDQCLFEANQRQRNKERNREFSELIHILMQLGFPSVLWQGDNIVINFGSDGKYISPFDYQNVTMSILITQLPNGCFDYRIYLPTCIITDGRKPCVRCMSREDLLESVKRNAEEIARFFTERLKDSGLIIDNLKDIYRRYSYLDKIGEIYQKESLLNRIYKDKYIDFV